MDTARDRLTKKVITASEYYQIESSLNYYWRSLRNNFQCPECGDILHFNRGSHNKTAYFYHSPISDQHGTCKLYTCGVSSNTTEAKLRSKLVEESDLSFAFELHYFSGKWSSYISIPPFSKSELDNHNQNDTVLKISNNSMIITKTKPH